MVAKLLTTCEKASAWVGGAACAVPTSRALSVATARIMVFVRQERQPIATGRVQQGYFRLECNYDRPLAWP